MKQKYWLVTRKWNFLLYLLTAQETLSMSPGPSNASSHRAVACGLGGRSCCSPLFFISLSVPVCKLLSAGAVVAAVVFLVGVLALFQWVSVVLWHSHHCRSWFFFLKMIGLAIGNTRVYTRRVEVVALARHKYHPRLFPILVLLDSLVDDDKINPFPDAGANSQSHASDLRDSAHCRLTFPSHSAAFQATVWPLCI